MAKLGAVFSLREPDTMPPIPQRAPAATAPALSKSSERALARSPRASFWHGCVQTLPFLLVIMPFGLLFGVVAAEAGLDITETMGFTVLVLAGASQFTAVQLINDHAPAIVVILSALAVNLRMAMYSASLVPWLGRASRPMRAAVAFTLIDQTYAMAIQQYEKHPRLSLPQRLAYFFGAAAATCLPWIVMTYLGATLGSAIPDSFALDFAVPITFLAMIAPLLRSIPHVIAAFVSVVLALVLAFLPSGLGLLIAAPCAMVAGASTESWLTRRRAP